MTDAIESGLGDRLTLIQMLRIAFRWLTDERAELLCFEVGWR